MLYMSLSDISWKSHLKYYPDRFEKNLPNNAKSVKSLPMNCQEIYRGSHQEADKIFQGLSRKHTRNNLWIPLANVGRLHTHYQSISSC